jgi:SNF2 family DNA or RNA helicase
MQQEFMDSMKLTAHIVRKQDALDLPDQVHEIRTVYLSPAEQRAYDTLKKEYVLRFSDEEVLAKTVMAEIMKLRQITSGFAYGENSTHMVGNTKLKELKNLLEELGKQQVIIWANFLSEIETLLKELPKSAALFSGTKDRETVISKFKKNKIQYLIANPMSAAHGLTFTNCHYAIYYSMNYSYELIKQSQDRIHRIGQNKKCTYFYLLAHKTIDEIIYKAVQDKHNLSESVLSYLRSHGRQRVKATA